MFLGDMIMFWPLGMVGLGFNSPWMSIQVGFGFLTLVVIFLDEIWIGMMFLWDVGCGIMSKLKYGSGFFRMRLKLPERDSTAVLHSHTPLHDEIDFEFLGGSKKTTLQTNVYTNGVGGREQRIHLWFDPTSDFHSYSILWNHYQLVFYIDDIPIRVFKNNTRLGVGYPTQGMMIEGTLWNGEGWASNGKPINWREGPFKAIYEGFKIEGCPSEGPIISKECDTSKYWWNGEEYRQLDSVQQRAYENVRRKYVNYDYCSDRWRYPVAPLECQEQ
ncbi:hypothetical protein PVL29_017950 [Vitis rotundifolia]|uniref:Xyloglucan endotransglucosylase/hydrolase n=1 Tax=Vitis rotundifolia TaxID=103349 RepID=A0AA39DFI2_VITRO|nr:hypothetical protein PVL29_017950 [Vitis rotundifolia]